MTRLIVVAGHATWDNGRWSGGYRGQEAGYESHILSGIELTGKDDVLVFSGGKTRPELNLKHSEARGMIKYAEEKGLKTKVVCEEHARDSFENIFYSLLAFNKETGVWPDGMTMVSFGFKGHRFNAIAVGMRIPHFRFHSIGDEFLSLSDREKATENEAFMIEKMIKGTDNGFALWDPLQRGDGFKRKRLRRTPYDLRKNDRYIWDVERSYGFGQVLCRLEATVPGPISWKDLKWPWPN